MRNAICGPLRLYKNRRVPTKPWGGAPARGGLRGRVPANPSAAPGPGADRATRAPQAKRAAMPRHTFFLFHDVAEAVCAPPARSTRQRASSACSIAASLAYKACESKIQTECAVAMLVRCTGSSSGQLASPLDASAQLRLLGVVPHLLPKESTFECLHQIRHKKLRVVACSPFAYVLSTVGLTRS